MPVPFVAEWVRVTIDHDFQIGLVSVCRPGHGRLHLPASSLGYRLSRRERLPARLAAAYRCR